MVWRNIATGSLPSFGAGAVGAAAGDFDNETRYIDPLANFGTDFAVCARTSRHPIVFIGTRRLDIQRGNNWP